jgi:serine/threonine protein kinase
MPVDSLSAKMQTIGNYELVEKIAEGGMGTVYRGRSLHTGETVAVKVVPQHLLSNPIVLKRFEQEYNVARLIDHPNIVKALDFGREGESRFLVMEYVEGESLGQRIERTGKMSEQEAIRVVSEAAVALQAAHQQGVIHRDVKPDNILLTANGGVKLTDLGLVKEIDADLNLTRTGRGLGTPHFMAPEQFRNAKNADARCDIYSLGATLYMMVTGQLPFLSNGPLDAWMKKINNDIDSPRKLNPELSERVDWAIRRAISPDPLHRPGTCSEFIEDLTGQTTQQLASTDPTPKVGQDYWYMIYSDENEVVHSVKGTIKGIRRSFKEGRLGDAAAVRVARTKAGPFEPLKNFAEFRDLVIAPESVLTPKKAASDPKTTRPQTGAGNVPEPVAPGVSDSVLLTTTTLGVPTLEPERPKTTPAATPNIHLNAPRNTWSSDWLTYVGLLLFFGGIGVLATFLLPTIIRYVRFM